jgi:hypothetical protein
MTLGGSLLYYCNFNVLCCVYIIERKTKKTFSKRKGEIGMKKFRGFAIGLLAGSVLMFTISSFAATVKHYMLVESSYPIYVNGQTYTSTDLPVLNYNGSTYIPMRAVGEVLGASVHWNEALRRAEIQYGAGAEGQAPVSGIENSAFRNVTATGSNGKYIVKGEARVFEAAMSYAVSDGHYYLFEKHHYLNEGAPEWSAFTLNIEIPKEQWPVNGTLMVELYEYSAKDGSKINIVALPLESFK